MSPLDGYLLANLKARHLRLLVALDDFGHLQPAAQLLCVTVPAVSKSLSELERGLGLRLFDRGPTGLRATAEGACLVRHARAMLAALQRAREELLDLADATSRPLRLGAQTGDAARLVPLALARLRERSPRTRVTVNEADVATLLDALRREDLDVVVGRLPPGDHSLGWTGEAGPLMLSLGTGPGARREEAGVLVRCLAEQLPGAFNAAKDELAAPSRPPVRRQAAGDRRNRSLAASA